MADSREPQYDPYIPSGGAAGGAGAQPAQGNQRTAALQAVSIKTFSCVADDFMCWLRCHGLDGFL
jgi:vesicle-associated membrane protein 4